MGRDRIANSPAMWRFWQGGRPTHLRYPHGGRGIRALRRPYGRGRGRAAVQVPRRSRQAGSAERFGRTGLAGGAGRGPKAPHEGGAGGPQDSRSGAAASPRPAPAVQRGKPGRGDIGGARVPQPAFARVRQYTAAHATPSGRGRGRGRRPAQDAGDLPLETAGARRAAADRAKRPPGTIRRRARHAGGGEPAGHIHRDVPACGEGGAGGAPGGSATDRARRARIKGGRESHGPLAAGRMRGGAACRWGRADPGAAIGPPPAAAWASASPACGAEHAAGSLGPSRTARPPRPRPRQTFGPASPPRAPRGAAGPSPGMQLICLHGAART